MIGSTLFTHLEYACGKLIIICLNFLRNMEDVANTCTIVVLIFPHFARLIVQDLKYEEVSLLIYHRRACYSRQHIHSWNYVKVSIGGVGCCQRRCSCDAEGAKKTKASKKKRERGRRIWKSKRKY